MLLILLALSTALIESPIAAFAFRRRDGYLYVLCISALVNLLTNLLLNALVLPALRGTSLAPLWDGWLCLLLGELVLAYGGEGVLYAVLVRNVSFGRGMLVSVPCNTVSLGLGLILWAILGGRPENVMTVGFALLCLAAGIVWSVCLAGGIIHEKNR